MEKVLLILFTLGFLQSSGQQNAFIDSSASRTANSQHDNVFTLSDKMPSFPGGPSGWSRYLQRNLDKTIPVKNNAPPGRYNVIVMFVINEKGNVSNLKPLTAHGFGMEDEVLRLIEKGPRWIPAVQKGRNVKSYRKQPLTFVVSNKIK